MKERKEEMNKKVRTLVRKTRAVSPIIATLLLVAIAVAASVITYSWVTSMLASQQSRAGTQISIENVHFMTNATGNYIVITARNTGTVSATIATVYVNDVAVTTQQTSKTIGISSSMDFTPTSPKWTASIVYKIKLVTDNGVPVEYSYTAPSS